MIVLKLSRRFMNLKEPSVRVALRSNRLKYVDVGETKVATNEIQIGEQIHMDQVTRVVRDGDKSEKIWPRSEFRDHRDEGNGNCEIWKCGKIRKSPKQKIKGNVTSRRY